MSNILAPILVSRILERLEVRAVAPSVPTLQRLVEAYVRVVPWESASRICRRAAVPGLQDRPRWPEQFWEEALALGLGGTCFESNYAFQALLTTLGYGTYLTINDMEESVGCHTAVVVEVEGGRWLADVGLPLFAPLELDARLSSRAMTPWMTYTAVPEDRARVRIEREPHPQRYVFTLVDQPVSDADYRAAATADYGPNGLFLNRVVINKLVDGRPWRYDSAEASPALAHFADGRRFDQPLTGDVPAAVAEQFGMDEETIRQALLILGQGEQAYKGAYGPNR